MLCEEPLVALGVARRVASVAVGLSRLGRGDGIDGSGQLCVIHFTAVGPGQTPIQFSRAKVRDAENRIVPAVFEPTFVVIQ